jgi:Protein of unknown function (DUF2851)
LPGNRFYYHSMTEVLLYFLWQKQEFTNLNLLTTQGEKLAVIHPGKRNLNAGPDFEDAWIRMENLRWNGHVEIHVKASDWLKHGHATNLAYNHIILHVVWEADRDIYYSNSNGIPTLELKNHVSAETLEKYKDINPETAQKLTCANFINTASRLARFSAFDGSLMERIHAKALTFLTRLKENNYQWEDSIYLQLAESLGYKTNAEAMVVLAKTLTLTCLKRYGKTLHRMEAMLLGQAGLLHTTKPCPGLNSENYKTLKTTYQELAEILAIAKHEMPAHYWKNGKLYPKGFPASRIRELAFYINKYPSLEVAIFNEGLPSVTYLASNFSANLAINTVAPILFAYGIHYSDHEFKNRALQLLEHFPPEQNYITRLWKKAGLNLANAADSQGSIERYNRHCLNHHCLNCPIAQEWLLKQHQKHETHEELQVA